MYMQERADWYKNPEFWEVYMPLMFDPDRIEDTPLEVDGIIRLAGLKEGSDVLDLCCGWGRHCFEFVRRGYNVCGVDITPSYLERGRNAALETGLEVRFIEEDVRTFVEPENYDFAMNFFTSFGYFEDPADDLGFCMNVCKSLRPGGRFLVDTAGKETVALKFREAEWFQRDGFFIMLEYKITDGWTHIENRWIFTSDNPEKKSEPNEAVFKHRLYSAMEMAGLLTEAGFSEVRFFGSLDGRPYDHKAERMIAVAYK